MARRPIEENGAPNMLDLLLAAQTDVYDTENVVERISIVRVTDLQYVVRTTYVGDEDFDAQELIWNV